MLIVQPLASLNSQKIRQCGARVIAESPERQFGQIAESQPQILARHCTEAGLIEKGAVLWGKAGQRSLERSALVEAMAQFTRALDQIATLPATPALRRKRIKLQVALINTLMHVKGYAAQKPRRLRSAHVYSSNEPKRLESLPRTRCCCSQCSTAFWVANNVAFNGDVVRWLAGQFLALAEKKGATVPLMIGHRLMSTSFLFTGDIAQGRVHLD